MNKCPNCGSTRLSGLMASFWVPISEDGDMEGEWNDYSGCTEIGPDRMCHDCETEFDGDYEPDASPMADTTPRP